MGSLSSCPVGSAEETVAHATKTATTPADYQAANTCSAKEEDVPSEEEMCTEELELSEEFLEEQRLRDEEIRRQVARKIDNALYMAGLQCVKKLYMARFNRNHATPPSALQVYGAAQKRLLKEVAHNRFPGGVTIAAGNNAVDETLSALDTANVIYNAVFTYNQASTKIDIMVRGRSGWLIYLPSAKKEVEDQHIENLAYKAHVAECCGISIEAAIVLIVNGDYVRDGEIDPEGLLLEEDKTGPVLERAADVPEIVKRFQDILETGSPEIGIGGHCKKHDCNFNAHCWSHIPKPSIFNIRGNKYKKWDEWDLYHTFIVRKEDAAKSLPAEVVEHVFGDNNVLRVKDIPDDIPPEAVEKLLIFQRRIILIEDIPEDVIAKMVKAQQTQVRCHIAKLDIFTQKDVQSFLSTLWYPLAHVDFEALFLTPVPMFDGTKPYENTPFQVSIHLQMDKFGPLSHFEYIGEPGIDPRPALIKVLLESIPDDACILAWNAMFEKGRIKELAKAYPEFHDQLMKLHDNIRDLMTPYQKRYVYSYEQNGSYSIKYVLPTRCPQLQYKSLDVQNGEQAAIAYVEMFYSTDPQRITVLRTGLFAYCGLDTFAMVMLLQDLEDRANPEEVNAARNIAHLAGRDIHKELQDEVRSRIRAAA